MITSIRHPKYVSEQFLWEKWRYVYEGGDEFVQRYLEKYSKLEDPLDFAARKKIAPSPSFAKAAVNDVKNSIFQRMSDIIRKDGTDSYMQAITGKKNGVDLKGSSMDAFMGRDVLPELLVLARVGIFVDMPLKNSITREDDVAKRPYLYLYAAEDILAWSTKRDDSNEFQSVLLRDHCDECDSETGLISGTWERYRLMFVDPDGQVRARFFKHEVVDGKTKEVKINLHGEPTLDDYELDIPAIPFVKLELTNSLLADVANHQIALLNLESSDISYALKSNFPFYTEQQDLRPGSHLPPAGNPDKDGSSSQANTSDDKKIKVGATAGRIYGPQMDRPGFIHPSSEPLEISMRKQQALKDDIKILINLNLSNIKSSAKMASAESKAHDERGLESGLSYIGLEMEHAERKIAKFWADYESAKQEPTIKYPEKYALMSDEDRRKKADQLSELATAAPSKLYTKMMQKEIVRTLLLGKVSQDEFDEVLTEIDKAPAFSADPKVIFEAQERGLCGNKLGVTLLGYPKGEDERAAEDHAERLARIAESQSSDKGTENPGARGLTDLDPDPGNSGAAEKEASRDTTQDGYVTEKVRGEGDDVRDSE